MAPLLPDTMSGAAAQETAGGDSQSRMAEYIGQLSVYSAELTFYTQLLAEGLKWLMIIACACLAGLISVIIYVRRLSVQSLNATAAARMSADCAIEQVTFAKEMAGKKLRAYVFTNGAKGELLANKNFTVRIEVKNFGATPAYRLNGWMGVFVDELANEKASHAMPHDFQTVETILPPGGICYYYAQTNHPVASQLKAIMASEKALYAYGEIRYSDVFNQSHYVKFKIKCAGERNLASGSFDHCAEGNEAD